jgi:hypothetical protein
MTLRIGDMVLCTHEGYHIASSEVLCFVEEVLTKEGDCRLTLNKGVKVSLYAENGEYVGDYWEAELQPLDERISEVALKCLIAKAVSANNWGLVLDFAKVWLAMIGDAHA